MGGSTPLIFSKGSRGKMKEVNPYYQRKAGYEAEKSKKSGDPEPPPYLCQPLNGAAKPDYVWSMENLARTGVPA